MLEIRGKKCGMNCGESKMVKANKFVFDVLNKLRITCDQCSQKGIPYSTYIIHEELCTINEKYGKINELERILKEKENEILSSKVYKSNEVLSDDELRKRLITFNLDVNQKMQLYQAAVEGNLAEFKDLTTFKKYPLLEEVSAPKYFWTPLHYAMHHGQKDIIFYILDTLNQKGELNNVMNLKSADNKTPILCLLKSNTVTLDKKKSLVNAILQKYKFNMSSELKTEMRNRNMENLIPQY